MDEWRLLNIAKDLLNLGDREEHASPQCLLIRQFRPPRLIVFWISSRVMNGGFSARRRSSAPVVGEGPER